MTSNKLMKQFLLPTLWPNDVFEQLNDLFGGLESYDPSTKTLSIQKGFPKGDIFFDKSGNRVIELQLAGYSKEQLKVEVGDERLTVSATKCEDEGEERAYTRARRAFTQTFTNLGNKDFDLKQTEVSYKDGLLRIVVPRKEVEETKPKTLEIK